VKGKKLDNELKIWLRKEKEKEKNGEYCVKLKIEGRKRDVK
jgi:hypothetical protein